MSADLPGLVQQIAHFEARLRDDPKSRAFLPLADLYRRTGKLERARQLLAGGLEADPACVSARAALGDVLVSLGDLAAARGQLQEVLDRDPQNLLALRLLAGDAATRGEWETARTLAERLLRLLPEDAEVRKLLREVRGRMTAAPAPPRPVSPAPVLPSPQADRGDQTADGALGIGSGLETPTLADLYRRQGYPEKARAIVMRILAAEPGRRDALEVLARLDGSTPPDVNTPVPPSAPTATGTPDQHVPASPPTVAGRANGTPLRTAPDIVAGRAAARPDDLDRFRAWLDRAADARDP